MNLSELQRIKQWHVAHKQTHPLEYQTWDAMLTLWLIGWVGWLPAFALEQGWLMPLPSLRRQLRPRRAASRRTSCCCARS